MAVPPPSSLPDAASTKAALRSRMRAARLRFVRDCGDGGLAMAHDALHRRLAALLARDGPLAGYVAHGGEPDVLPFLHDAFERGHRIALPHVPPAGAMSFADWRPGTVLLRGALGIGQPAAAGIVEPMVLLVPLLGFDRRGTRLGQGGGHYDRWLAAHPTALRIGIAWSMQEVDALPADPWDMSLHAIVTERERIDP